LGIGTVGIATAIYHRRYGYYRPYYRPYYSYVYGYPYYYRPYYRRPGISLWFGF
jgi:hypothetical protein